MATGQRVFCCPVASIINPEDQAAGNLRPIDIAARVAARMSTRKEIAKPDLATHSLESMLKRSYSRLAMTAEAYQSSQSKSSSSN
jgi:hypothetical protein